MTTRTVFQRPHRLRSMSVGLTFAVAASGLAMLPMSPSAAIAAPANADLSGPADPASADQAQDMAQAASQAAATGEEVEVPSLTTQTNQVVAQPGGAFKLEAHREPVRTDINGEWEPIDTTLEVASDGSIRPKAITIPVEFAPGGSNEAVTTGEGDHSITFTWNDGPLPAPVISGSEVTYPDVRPGVDLVFTAHPDGYTDALVVKTPAAAAALQADPAEFTGSSAGLDLSMTAEGAVVAESSSTDIALVSPPPIAWDSSGGGVGNDRPNASSSGTGVVHELEPAVINEPEADKKAGVESTVSIELAPPATALADPATVYPLYLDPAITGKGNSHYLTVHSKGWDYYDAANQVMRVGYCGWAECNNSTQGNARSFFSFQIDPLKVAGADPVVFDASVQAKQVWSADSAAQPVNLTKAQPFTAGTNYPGPFGARLQQIASSAGRNGNNEGWITFGNENVRQYLEDRAKAEDDWVQFSLSAPSEGDALLWKKFANDTKLTVLYGFVPTINSYTASGVVTCGTTVYSRGSITTSVDATEVGTQKAGLQYMFELFQSDATTIIARRPVDWSSADSYTWPSIAEGTYTWRARVSQPTTVGSTVRRTERASVTANRRFTVDRTPPKDVVISSDDFPEDYWGNSSTTGGNFTITIPNAEASAIAYAFNGAPPNVPDSTCIPTGPGYQARQANHGTITLPATNLKPGVPNTLTVYGFDLAHNRTSTVTYTFYPSRGDLPGNVANNRVQGEASGAATSGNASAPVTLTGVLPDGSTTPAPGTGQYLTMNASSPEAYAEVEINPTAPGYYALGAELGTCPSCGKATFTIENAQEFDEAPISTDAELNGRKYVGLGGYQLQAGPNKVKIRFPDASASTPATVKLDYLRLTQIRSGEYSSLQAAFNNDGIVSESWFNPMGLEPARPAVGSQPAQPNRALSQQALAAAGVVPGQNLTATFSDNAGAPATATFAIPAQGADGLDNVIAAGQEISLPNVVADHVDLLVAASCGNVSPELLRQFDLRQLAEGGGEPSVRNYMVPYTVPEWRDPLTATNDPAPAISVNRFVSGATATVVNAPAGLYVIEIDVLAGLKGRPLKSITLPSTGATLTTTASGCDQPRLHVFSITTRSDQ
ncbi:hypothetical protein [Pimelobacter sp. 30-1]|uniref:hypothetical protein n=1 Tax=Pimelobacter sp. 30-1 TaxID=2004991 RepID=UPI001C048732|nr:hypothetical protein [Pimelobacter sp. 30-1]